MNVSLVWPGTSNVGPVIQIHLSASLSLDGYASWSVDLHGSASAIDTSPA